MLLTQTNQSFQDYNMKKILLLTLPLLLLASPSNDMQDRIQSLEKQLQEIHDDLDERMPIIEKNERKSILDKVNFSPELQLRFDQFNYSNRGIEGENTLITDTSHPDFGKQRRDEFNKSFDPSVFMRFRLNMSANIGDAKFHGRLVYGNSTQSNQRLCILSRDIKSGATSSSAFDVDRAYVDYSPNREAEYAFTFTFGLLPTTDGSPMQYKQDKKRTSLFPSLVFDMNTYGIIATQKIAKETFLRLIIAKAYTLRTNFYPYQCNRENLFNASVIGMYADTKYKFLGDGLLSFGVNTLSNFKAQPYLGPDMDIKDANDLGTMITLGLGTDITNLVDTQTTLFIHTALSNPHPNGKIDDYQITVSNPDGFTDASYATGPMLQKNGYSVFVGTKYKFNDKWNMGAEYNYGSKYWFSATQGAEDMFNKLSTRGHAYELYTNWTYAKHLNARLSYLGIKENYTGSGWHFGEPAKKDATQDIFSLTLDARF